jgi:hypothetical protein
MEKVNVCTTLWVRASRFEWHVLHKIVQKLTFYVQKRRKIINNNVYELVKVCLLNPNPRGLGPHVC